MTQQQQSAVRVTLLRRDRLCLIGMLLLSAAFTVARADAQLAPGMDAAPENRYPNEQYYVALELYREGDLATATAAFDAALRGTRRDEIGRWIDAIPVHAMLGECFYQSGDLPAAVEQIDAALTLAVRHSGWLERIYWAEAFENVVRSPDTAAAWVGPDAAAILPLRTLIPLETGGRDLEAQIRRGGRFESQRATLVDAGEILRGLATAFYRRRIIFGPLAAEYEIALHALDATPYPSRGGADNVRALVGAARACGRFAAGRDNEALTESNASAFVGGQIHPVSPLALLAKARVLAESDNYADAVPIALQAAAAASLLGQPEWVGEAFLVAAGCAEPTTAPAIQARATAAAGAHLRRGRVASIGSLLAATQASLASGDVGAAQASIGQAATMLQRRGVVQPRSSATAEWLSARVLAGQGGALGSTPAIETALSRMLAFAYGSGGSVQRRGAARGGGAAASTPRLFQLELIQLNTKQRGIGGKAVDERLKQYVNDVPAGLVPPSVWRADAVDALAFESFNHSAAVAAYLVSCAERQQRFEVLVQSDSLLRHRFLNELPLGGRVQQVRRLAATDRELLTEPAAAMFLKPPEELARMLEILAAPAPMAGSAELVARGERLESLATQMALRAMPVAPTMPPPIVAPSDLERLPEGTAMLTYAVVGEAMVATLSSRGQVQVWNTPPPRVLAGDVAKILKGIGAIHLRGASRLDDAAAWRSDAAALRSKLVPDEIFAQLDSVSQLIIVPDGVLWYLPFELLSGDDAGALWVDRFRVSYSPSPGLVLHPVAHDQPDRPTGVVSQLFFAPRDADGNNEYLKRITDALQLHQPLPAQPPITTSLVGESVGRLAVFGAVTPNVNQLLMTSPGIYDRSAPGGSLSGWMRFPNQVPVNVFLPGFRTAAVNPALGDGRELAVTLMALHSSGVRNAVLSRWPVGGESAAVLFQEFLQELPYDDVQTAWHRAVSTLRRSRLDPNSEPLLPASEAQRDDLDGDHPLFWAGYLLDASL